MNRGECMNGKEIIRIERGTTIGTLVLVFLFFILPNTAGNLSLYGALGLSTINVVLAEMAHTKSKLEVIKP